MSVGRGSWKREGALVGAVLVAGLAVRLAFLVRQGVPIFDPWRHLELVRNLRAGLGFTLFDGQPYIWYGEAWYRLCASVPLRLEPQRLAGLLSWLSIAALWVWLRTEERGGDAPRTALAAAIVAAGFGPLVAFTCHYGPESFALFLLLAALALAAAVPGAVAAGGAGLLFGAALATRMNLAFDAFLFLPAVRTRRRAAAFAAGAALPLAAAWIRNHRAIAAYPYLFTWDGLATRTADFNPVSTLVLQLHPAIREGLKRLHEQIVPFPEWVSGPAGIAWGPLLFMLLGTVCLVASRRWHLVLAGFSTLGYFLLLDGSKSSNFFRIWLGLFPVFFAAIAAVATRVAGVVGPARRVASWGLVALALAAGASGLEPLEMYPIGLVTPPPALLENGEYMVNSSFYHPESVMWRYPDKRFIGMPLDPSQFEDFRRRYAGYRCVLWHDFSVQDDLLAYLLGPGGYEVSRAEANEYGRRYAVLCPKGAGASGTSTPSPPGSSVDGGSSTR